MADSPVNNDDSFNESLDGNDARDTNESSHTSSQFASSFNAGRGGDKVGDDADDRGLRARLSLYSNQQSINKYSGSGHSKEELDDSEDSDVDMGGRRAQAATLVHQSTVLKKSYGDEDEGEEDGQSSTASRTSAINVRQESSGSKFESAYTYKYTKQSTAEGDLGDDYHHIEHRHVEFEDDEEDVPSPAAASSLQSSFKLETKKSVETEEALQFKFTTNYQMSEKEFKSLKSFFERIQGGGRASIKLVFKLLAQQLDKKCELIQANKEDVGRAVQAIDTDEDGLINFNEFVDLLRLFFAKSSNVGARVEMLLNNRSFTNLKSYSLSPDEARAFLNFLDDFYGAPAGTSSSLRVRPELSDRISNAKFAELIAPVYSQLTYLV